MTLKEIQQLARQRGTRPGKRGKAELVRTLQRAEGSASCFETGQAASCGQDLCLWRSECR
jgi:hypothetical protein